MVKLQSNQLVSCTCACHELEENHDPEQCYCMTGQNDNFEKWIDEHEIKKILTKTDYYKTVVTSDKKVIFGKHAQTLLVSNVPLIPLRGKGN